MFNKRKISYGIYFFTILSFQALAQGCGDQEIDCDEFMSNETLAERVCTAGEMGEDLVIDYINPVLQCIFPGVNDHNFMNRVAAVESNFGQHHDTYRRGYHGGIYQVDRVGFRDTKKVRSHPLLRIKIARVENVTGINWLDVKWKDLRKPLYSGIAARLFVSNIKDKIPESIEKQAPYWKNKYNKSNKNVDMAIKRFIDVAWKICKNKTEAIFKTTCKSRIVAERLYLGTYPFFTPVIYRWDKYYEKEVISLPKCFD